MLKLPLQSLVDSPYIIFMGIKNKIKEVAAIKSTCEYVTFVHAKLKQIATECRLKICRKVYKIKTRTR